MRGFEFGGCVLLGLQRLGWVVAIALVLIAKLYKRATCLLAMISVFAMLKIL